MTGPVGPMIYMYRGVDADFSVFKAGTYLERCGTGISSAMWSWSKCLSVIEMPRPNLEVQLGGKNPGKSLDIALQGRRLSWLWTVSNPEQWADDRPS